MFFRTWKPLDLLPPDTVPSADVLAAGQNPSRPDPFDRNYSDLFPQNSYHDFEGPLGRYLGGDPHEGHPLYPAMQGLYEAYYAFAAQERDNDFQRTEATSRGLRASMLQKYIASCIAKGYDNLVEQFNPAEAVQFIAAHVEAQEEKQTADYNTELDHHTTMLASVDRGDEEPTPEEIDGIPVISGRDIVLALGQVPESPEVERENRKEYAKEQISVVRKRLVRLRFEYMSAMALTSLLQKSAA